MRAMVAAALAAVVALASAGNAFAKTSSDTQPAPKVHKAEKMLKGLNLTDKQKVEVKEILAQAKKDIAKAKDKQAKAEIHKAAYEKIRTNVLTDAQRKQLDEQHKAKPAKVKAKVAAKPAKASMHKVAQKPVKA